MVAWGPIIGAGISALGSLFGKDDDEKVVRQEVDYEAMARNAEKAGFNPLTAIRNGGSAGFTNTIHPALSSAAGFGEAFATLGNALMSFDARADERAALEDRLMQAQISALNRSGEAASRSFAMDTPSAAGSTTVDANGRPQQFESRPASVTNPYKYLAVNPALADAEAAETRYGDILQEVFGIGNAIGDVATNIKKNTESYDFWKSPAGKVIQMLPQPWSGYVPPNLPKKSTPSDPFGADFW